jgi:ligand-binding sensor domain-containing protein
LPDNDIIAIYLHHDKIWIGTESGLAYYDIKKRTISSFGLADGLPAEPLTTIRFWFDSVYQKLYVGFNNTIVRFKPDKFVKNNVPPDFSLTTLRSAAQKQSIIQLIELNLAINIIALR